MKLKNRIILIIISIIVSIVITHLFAIFLINITFDSTRLNYPGYRIEMESEYEKYLIVTKPNDTITISSWGAIFDVRKMKYIDNFDSLRISYIGSGGCVVSPLVLWKESRYDSTFLLIVQDPLYKYDRLYKKYHYEQLSRSYYGLPRNSLWFWIINVKKDTLYGPLTKERFLEKRVEVGVPDELQINFDNLDTVYKFKYYLDKGERFPRPDHKSRWGV